VFDRNQIPKTGNCWKITQAGSLALSMLIHKATWTGGQVWGQRIGEVYLESGQRQRLLQVVNEQERLSVRLTNGLQQITSDRTAKVYFQGH